MTRGYIDTDIRCRRCGSNWMSKDARTRGQQMHMPGDCKRKQVADAEQPRLPEQVKRRAVQMRIEGESVSAAARVVEDKRSIGEQLGQKGAIALDEMWTYLSARKEE